ncbi:hypothetical protein [Bradyrhizobium sp. NP1]|uniref:hypothetical protein n=1 Tax=Bradyrhizobium sp. NP1 TaxID=3049772 RepID=UPI0025A65BB7|nr:hypothetical protein [Bradyrhizobium sp. NP1]WJR74928.1 hypothetical protein QOU61_19055 [Bradyrhizobium sp. NP1]
MNRLQKFIELGSFGEGPGRTAYVLDANKLPEPNDGLKWSAVTDFSIGDAILADPGLKPVFEQALRQGFAIVTQRT